MCGHGMLDAQIGVLVRGVDSRAMHVPLSWAGVKALLHGRGINMRHWKSTGALTGEASAQVEALMRERVDEGPKEFDKGL